MRKCQLKCHARIWCYGATDDHAILWLHDASASHIDYALSRIDVSLMLYLVPYGNVQNGMPGNEEFFFEILECNIEYHMTTERTECEETRGFGISHRIPCTTIARTICSEARCFGML